MSLEAGIWPALPDSRPERADFRPERVDFRPERVDFRPERAWGNGWKDGCTKVPLFYRTLSPLGPLPCFLSLQLTIMQSSIAEHILPLGDLLISGLFAPFLV